MRSALLVLLGVPAVAGCTGSVSEPVEAGGPTTTSAVVSIERTSDPLMGSRAEASARVLRVGGATTADEALRAIGAALDLPATGTCVDLSSRSDSPAGALPVVELLDVGGVSIEAGASETRLTARQLPDVTDVVTGVVYSRAVDPALLPAAAPYSVRVAGGAGFEGFEARATAPDDASDLRVTGEDAGGVLVSGSSIDLTWTAGAGDDVVYVDVRPRGARCAMVDAGRGSLSTGLLDDAGTIVLHRLHREALRVPGVSGGEIRFDFARSVPYARR